MAYNYDTLYITRENFNGTFKQVVRHFFHRVFLILKSINNIYSVILLNVMAEVVDV